MKVSLKPTRMQSKCNLFGSLTNVKQVVCRQDRGYIMGLRSTGFEITGYTCCLPHSRTKDESGSATAATHGDILNKVPLLLLL